MPKSYTIVLQVLPPLRCDGCQRGWIADTFGVPGHRTLIVAAAPGDDWLGQQLGCSTADAGPQSVTQPIVRREDGPVPEM